MITSTNATEIRKRYFKGFYSGKYEDTVSMLAEEYKCSKGNISSIINFKTFKSSDDIEMIIEIILLNYFGKLIQSTREEFQININEIAVGLNDMDTFVKIIFNSRPNIRDYYFECRNQNIIQNRKLYKEIFKEIFV